MSICTSVCLLSLVSPADLAFRKASGHSDKKVKQMDWVVKLLKGGRQERWLVAAGLTCLLELWPETTLRPETVVSGHHSDCLPPSPSVRPEMSIQSSRRHPEPANRLRHQDKTKTWSGRVSESQVSHRPQVAISVCRRWSLCLCTGHLHGSGGVSRPVFIKYLRNKCTAWQSIRNTKKTKRSSPPS